MAARNLAPSERAALRLKNLHRTRNDEFVPASFRRGSLNTAATDTLLSQSKQYDATNLSEFIREEKGILLAGGQNTPQATYLESATTSKSANQHRSHATKPDCAAKRHYRLQPSMTTAREDNGYSGYVQGPEVDVKG